MGMRTNEEILTAALGTHIGAPTGAVGPEMRRMLADGLIGENGGLTRKGSIRAQQLKRAQEEELFPL